MIMMMLKERSNMAGLLQTKTGPGGRNEPKLQAAGVLDELGSRSQKARLISENLH